MVGNRIGIASYDTESYPPRKTTKPPLKHVPGDARNMHMFETRSFDVVFSNSVIEHVGDISNQRMMAKEVMRVGKNYWVQTPYKHFPIEMHFLFPFFQYLPKSLQYKVARIWPWSFAKALDLDVRFEIDHIWLLDVSSLKSLFPGAIIMREYFLGLVKSLIAVAVESKNNN